MQPRHWALEYNTDCVEHSPLSCMFSYKRDIVDFFPPSHREIYVSVVFVRGARPLPVVYTTYEILLLTALARVRDAHAI
jgi:hypothetical protein